MDLEKIKKNIDESIDEATLKELRDYAAQRLGEVRSQKEMGKKAELENQYKGKYVLCLGHKLSMNFHSEPNPNDIKIVYVEDTDFKGNGFFQCKARVIHIQYDNEYDTLSHLSAEDYGQIHVSYEYDERYSFRDSDIERIIPKEEVIKLLKEVKKNTNKLIEEWEQCLQ